MKNTIVRAALLLGTSSMLAGVVAIYPAGANSTHQTAKAKKPINCSSNLPCVAANNADSGPGVQGTSSGSGAGVYGGAALFDGVYGLTISPSTSNGAHAGVGGYDQSTDGGSLNYGVFGQSANGSGVGGTSTSYVGVYGLSADNVAVFGQSTHSVSVSGTGVAGNEITSIQGIGGTSGDPTGLTLATFQKNGAASFWVDNAGNAHVSGLLYTSGFCSTGCAKQGQGAVSSYATQSSTPTLEDIGEGRLVDGTAHIQLDSALARAIDRSAYAVFVSPEGPNRGLYVTDKSASGFTVAENPGGRSSIPFSYRIVARPYGVNAARLPTVQVPQPVLARASRSHRR